MRFLTVTEVARHLEGEVVGDASLTLSGFAPATAAKTGELTFAENAEYFAAAEKSAAAAILVSGDFRSASKTLIRVKNARLAFAKVLPLFFPETTPAPGIHPSAVIAVSAQVDPTAHIGPHCIVGERVRIGARVVLAGCDCVGDDSTLGDETRLFPNVTIYPLTQIGRRVRIHAGTVVGSDGFGYVPDQGRHLKVPQIGNVIIGDDVELGANVTVDRGALGPTVIGQGAKIDNLVQIGHNVQVGDHSIIVAQAGVAGSTEVGQYVTIAGQVGIAGHLRIGNQVTIEAKSGVMTNIPDGEKWLGSPAQPDKQTKRQFVAIMQLPNLIKRVRELEKKLGEQK